MFSTQKEISVVFAGKVLEYEYVNGEVYQLRFADKTVTWECLAGSAAGSSVTQPFDAVEITANVLWINWLDQNGELVRIVADVEKKIAHCIYVYQGTRRFWRGTIKYFGPAALK